MAMSYTTLVAPKGTTGSLLNWIAYTKVDVPTVLDEAQILIYTMLRVREMRTEYTFGMAAGQANAPLPARFLDPDGSIYDITNSAEYDQRLKGAVLRGRCYDTSPSGTLDVNPFTTTLNSALVAVHEVAHGLNQDSTITFPAGPTVNGLSMLGSFPVVSITGPDDFVVDTGSDTGASATGSGGGAAGLAWTANNLISGSPTSWGVWDERIKFDFAFDQPAVCKLPYYRQPKLLATDNQTNFLTTRYPTLIRTACLASAAQYMKDDGEYTKNVQALTALIQSTAATDDLSYRGANFGTDTP